MSTIEPTSPETVGVMTDEQELSIEQVAQIQKEDASSAQLQEDATCAQAQEGEASRTAAAPGPVPIPGPLPLPKRRVSGRYRSGGAGFQLELRVDVDGARPMMRLSGDFYQITGATTTYFGSFVVNAPAVSVTATQVTIEGMGQYTFAASYPKVRVTIPRVSILSPPAAATVRFFNAANAPGAAYSCAFVSQYFRTVQIEQDFVAGTALFNSYNTGALPSGGPARDLSVVKAYAEAGIEMQVSAATNIIPPGTAGPTWNDGELHHAMEVNFSLFRNDPQWKVWLFLATRYDVDGVRGIMFDQQGLHRQGCAVFYDAVQGADPVSQRGQLRTYVHELGHCFNLMHSFQKSAAVPPQPNRLGAKSWMHYPQNYVPGGTPAYWAAFPFQFDDPEVIHLRHAFRNNIIMGGNNFSIGAADYDPQAFDDPVAENSGLRLELSSRKRFAFAEPVAVEIKLSATDPRGKEVSPYLHPKDGLVKIGIRKPSGRTTVYEPLISRCAEEGRIVLDAANPSVSTSAYIGYGREGFYFDQAGIYQLRAFYQATDGSLVYSNIIRLRVGHPVTANDEAVAELFLGEEQGTLLFLLGSDSEFLRKGNEAFDEVIERHDKHPLAAYAKMVKGVNLARQFKYVTAEKKLTVREAKPKEAADYLTDVVGASPAEATKLIDPTTIDMTLGYLAEAQDAMGDKKAAKATRDRITPKVARAARSAGAGAR